MQLELLATVHGSSAGCGFDLLSSAFGKSIGPGMALTCQGQRRSALFELAVEPFSWTDENANKKTGVDSRSSEEDPPLLALQA